VLGGLAYTTTGGMGGTQSDPMFINNESSLSITLGEVNFGAPNYSIYDRETRGGVTRQLADKDLPSYVGRGKHLSLYTGYQAN